MGASVSRASVDSAASAVTKNTSSFSQVVADGATDSFFTTTTKNADEASAAAKKADTISTLKQFESVPSSSSTLSKTASFMASNPKITALGITTVAAAGYITAQMANGLSFEEAWNKLLEIVEGVASEVVSTGTEAATGIFGVAFSSLMESLLGENWMMYVYGVLGLVGIVFLLKIYRIIQSILA